MRHVLLFSFFLVLLMLPNCQESTMETHMQLLVDKVQDGYVRDWTTINAIDPPPPAPFRYRGGTPIDFTWVNIPQTGPAAEVEVDFFITMGTVGRVQFTHVGSAPDVATSTSRIENALNSWVFSNNGSGEVILRINFGVNKATLDFSRMPLLNGVKLEQQSFYTAFRAGNVEFK